MKLKQNLCWNLFCIQFRLHQKFLANGDIIMRCIKRNHSIYLIALVITTGIFQANVWANSLKYKLKLSGYSDQQIDEILRGKQSFQKVKQQNRSNLIASNKSHSPIYLNRDNSLSLNDSDQKKSLKKHHPLAAQFFKSYIKRHKKNSDNNQASISSDEARRNIKERFFYHKRPPKYDLIDQMNNEEKSTRTKGKVYSRNRFVEKVKPYLNFVEDASYQNNVKKSLILAVITVESGFNHRAVSPKGAQGLMQLMPFTAKSMGVENPFDPMQNIHGGTRYLSQCLKKLQNIKLALAAYNAGITRVARLCKIPPFRETQNFVKKVLRYEKMYDKMIQNL